MYKLINKQTGESHLCEKVTKNGFDYFVSDEKPKQHDVCLTSTDAVHSKKQKSLNNIFGILIKDIVDEHEIICRVQFGEDIANLPFDISELKKVIATNNPNHNVFSPHMNNIPKVVDEVEIKLNSILQSDEGLYSMIDNLSFKVGFNKAKETYPNSDEDMVEFLIWREENCYYNTNGVYQLKKGSKGLTPKELLQLWKSLKPKTVYYE